MEKFGENVPFFGAFFGAFFGTFFGTFFGGQLFSSKSEKFVQNPFCKRDPLRLFYLPGKHENFRGRISEQISEKLRFKFRDFFRKLRSAEV